MSDESVKVKVGADFSEAEKAAEKSGEKLTGMGKYFGDYVGSLKDKLLSGLALESIVDKSIEAVKSAFDWTSELRDTSERTGVALDTLQRLNSVAKRTGVSMESMGRMLSFANKSIGTAQAKAGDHRETLQRLGFTTDQVINKEVKAEMVFQALAESYSKGTDAASMQRDAQILLGRSAMQNMQIFKLGGLQMKNMIETTSVFSDEQIRAMDRTARAYERAGNAWEKMKRKIAIHAMGDTAADANEFIRESILGDPTSMPGVYKEETDPEKLRKNMLKQIGEMGWDLDDLQDIKRQIDLAREAHKEENRGFIATGESAEARTVISAIRPKQGTIYGQGLIQGNEAIDTAFMAVLEDIIAKMTPRKAEDENEGEGVAKGTSLQAVGGGDWIVSNTISATERIATATEASQKELASINQKTQSGTVNKTNIAK